MVSLKTIYYRITSSVPLLDSAITKRRFKNSSEAVISVINEMPVIYSTIKEVELSSISLRVERFEKNPTAAIINELDTFKMTVFNEISEVVTVLSDSGPDVLTQLGSYEEFSDGLIDLFAINPRPVTISIVSKETGNPQIILERYEGVERVVTGAIYKHFKGDDYKVEFLIRDEATGEIKVAYTRLRDHSHHYRVYSSFISYAEVDGVKVKRFILQ